MKSSSSGSENNWQILHLTEGDKHVIIRFLGSLPSEKKRIIFSELCVITWDYDHDESGMPDSEDHKRMNELEDILERELEECEIGIQSACRTGNGRREWNYFTASKSGFMSGLNGALGHLPPFPIEIRFFEDPHWDSLRDLFEFNAE